MAALTAASWTVVLTHKRRGNRTKVHEGTMAIPGTDTYPDGGIPLPVFGKFGFIRDLRNLVMWGVDATTGTVAEYHSRVDKANNKLFLYEEEAAAAGGPLLEADTAEVPGARTWNFRAEGW